MESRCTVPLSAVGIAVGKISGTPRYPWSDRTSPAALRSGIPVPTDARHRSLRPNSRGSTGYGQRFTQLDNGRLRPNAVKDMAAAVGWLAATGKVDASNVAVMGDSYVGYMTLPALTHFPDKFKAGV